ncbi:MAG: lytic transglycosylase domain-containing protein [Nocardioides sp.]
MSKYHPQHRASPARAHAGPRLVRGAVVASGLAVAATGMTVSGGVLSTGASDAGADLPTADLRAASSGTRSDVTSADLRERTQQVSRSDRRDRRDAAKLTALGTAQGAAMSRTEDLSTADPREIGRALLVEYGFGADEFECLDALYVSESDWRIDADNPISSAYGIPQALTSMHELPADYMTSAESQIRWGLEYISGSYGTPCSAWGFKQGHGLY